MEERTVNSQNPPPEWKMRQLCLEWVHYMNFGAASFSVLLQLVFQSILLISLFSPDSLSPRLYRSLLIFTVATEV